MRVPLTNILSGPGEAFGIAQGLERLRQADLMGITLPRKYGGPSGRRTKLAMADWRAHGIKRR